jgi:uncharacterized Rmd1/YagE family protein
MRPFPTHHNQAESERVNVLEWTVIILILIEVVFALVGR